MMILYKNSKWKINLAVFTDRVTNVWKSGAYQHTAMHNLLNHSKLNTGMIQTRLCCEV